MKGKGLGFDLLRAPAPLVDIGFNIAHKDFAHDLSVRPLVLVLSLFGSHFRLFSVFLQDVLARAAQCNVTRMICTGTSAKSTKDCIAIVAKLSS